MRRWIYRAYTMFLEPSRRLYNASHCPGSIVKCLPSGEDHRHSTRIETHRKSKNLVDIGFMHPFPVHFHFSATHQAHHYQSQLRSTTRALNHTHKTAMGIAVILSIILAVYNFCCMVKNPNYFNSYKYHLLLVITKGLCLIDAINYLVKREYLYNQPRYASDHVLSGYRHWQFATTFITGLHVLGWCLLAGKALVALRKIAWPKKVKIDEFIGKEKEKKYPYRFIDGPFKVRFHFDGSVPGARK
jgi:hypothetical protein